MDLRKLRHAVVIARCQSFTKAANELGITQSALSRSLQSLEDELGLRLFDRDSKMVFVTQAGREILRRAEAMLRSEADLKGVARHASKGEGGSITLGVTPFAARVLLPEVLSRRVDKPHFHAEVLISSGRQLLPMVMQERIDMCVCTGEQLAGLSSGLSSVHLSRVRLALIVRRNHPLTHVADPTHKDVMRYPIVRSIPYYEEDVPRVIVGAEYSAHPALTIDDYDVLAQVTASSDAVWITSPLVASNGIKDGLLVQRPISWLAETPDLDVVAYFPANRTLSPTISTVLKEITTIGLNLLDEQGAFGTAVGSLS